MSLQLEITTIMHNLIKDYYFNYLEEHKLLLIQEDCIKDIVNSYYENKKDFLKKKIREDLNQKTSNAFDKLAVENMIFEIFSDKGFAINKIVRDILNYQNDKILNININYSNDLGLKVDITEFGVCISNVTNTSDDFNDISAGDYIIEIDKYNLLKVDNTKRIEILKNLKQIIEDNRLKISIFKNT